MKGYLLRDRQTGEQYVGITTRWPRRLYEHRQKGPLARRDLEVVELVEFADATAMRQWEVETISRLGLDNLLNQSAGGFGGFGRKWTPEMRARMSEGAKARQADPELRRKMSESCRKAWSGSEARRKQSERARASINKPARSAAQKRLWQDPDVRAKRVAGITAKARTPEGRESRRQAQLRRWHGVG